MLDDLPGILVSVPITYFAIILFIRLSGKRSTSQMNNFDWIVTVTVGSIAASTMLLDEVTLIEGLSAMALLLGLQYCVTAAVKKWSLIEKLVKASPAILYANGAWCDEAMRDERVTRSEVMAAVRAAGYDDLTEVQEVVLESDAGLSVVAQPSTTNDAKSTQPSPVDIHHGA